MPKCKTCKAPFKQNRIGQKTCEVYPYECSIEYGKSNKKKEIRKKKTVFKQSDKSLLKDQVQALANRIGKISHILEVGNDICVTCGKIGGKKDGGHFLPTSTYPAIRYYTKQIKPQCITCNQYNGGMPIEYTSCMIEKYGIEFVKDLQSQKRVTRKYSLEYYQKYKKVMTKRKNKLEKRLSKLL